MFFYYIIVYVYKWINDSNIYKFAFCYSIFFLGCSVRKQKNQNKSGEKNTII